EAVAYEHIGPAEQRRAHERHVEVLAVGAPEHGDDLQAEHRETPEDEEMEPAGERLAHPRHLGADELLLPERDGDHRPQPLRDAIDSESAGGRAQQVEPTRYLVD